MNAARAAMILGLGLGCTVPMIAQQVQDTTRSETRAPVNQTASAEPVTATGPRVQPELRRVQPTLRDSTQTRSEFKKGTVVITATTLGLILILAILLVLL